jgi:hypothetical protein
MKEIHTFHVEIDLKDSRRCDFVMSFLSSQIETMDKFEYNVTQNLHIEGSGESKLEDIKKFMHALYVIDAHSNCRLTVYI